MTWSPAIRELLAAHEIFRRLGFLPQNLYVDIYPNGCGHPPPCKGLHVQFALRIGGKETEPVFKIDINEDCSDVSENWTKAVEWWNSSERNKEELNEIYWNTSAGRNKAQLLIALGKKGLLVHSSDMEAV